MAGKISIAPLDRLSHAVAKTPPDFLISILGPSDKLPFPKIVCSNTLRLSFDDVGITTDRFTAPSTSHIEQIISFARLWDGRGNLIVHCKAGTSRSPAAAMIVAVATNRMNLAREIGCGRPYFRPNRTMLRMADEILFGQKDYKNGLINLEDSIRRLDTPTDTSTIVLSVD